MDNFSMQNRVFSGNLRILYIYCRGYREKSMNQRILCTTLTMGAAFSTTVLAQEDVVAPFWCAVDSVSMSLGNTAKDLYTDLSLVL